MSSKEISSSLTWLTFYLPDHQSPSYHPFPFFLFLRSFCFERTLQTSRLSGWWMKEGSISRLVDSRSVYQCTRYQLLLLLLPPSVHKKSDWRFNQSAAPHVRSHTNGLALALTDPIRLAQQPFWTFIAPFRQVEGSRRIDFNLLTVGKRICQGDQTPEKRPCETQILHGQTSFPWVLTGWIRGLFPWKN